MVGLREASPKRSGDQARTPHLSAGVRLGEVFESGVRLEASTFAPEARAAVEDLRQAGFEVVSLYGTEGLSDEAHNAFRFKRIYVGEDRGIPFLTSADIINLRPRGDRFLSRKRTPKLNELMVRKWDVLISRSGTIGNVALAGATITDLALSEDAIRWRCDEPALAGYVTAFLRSDVGRLQLKRVTYGSVIKHIEPDHLKHILVPDLHPILRTEIGMKMCQATELRDQANGLFDTASARLHEALGLPPIGDLLGDKVAVPFATVRARALQGRLDAGFHKPLVHRVLNRLQVLPVGSRPLKHPGVTREIRPITCFRKRTYVRSGVFRS
jgi:type I restriction enzyme S subunit